MAALLTVAHDGNVRPMRCACIDVGSNTTRLLVAEPDGSGGLREVLARRAFTRLGGGRGPSGALDPRRVAATGAEVARQVLEARATGARAVHVVATAAIRSAPNGEAACAAIGSAAGLEVRVLSGEEEARLAFRGATSALARTQAPGTAGGPVAVVDVGGGSTEVVCGSAEHGPVWLRSLDVGSASLTERWIAGDPPTQAELASARAAAAAAFARLGAPGPAAAYAVGGAATSLRRLGGQDLGPAALARGLELLCADPVDRVARRHTLHPVRVRMLPAALVLLDAAGAALGVPLRSGSGGLREGLMLEHWRSLGIG
jgi:exopolyphosphatase/guanosine-5'-triphosphate,3'-diphosphate pyrophosphatase